MGSINAVTGPMNDRCRYLQTSHSSIDDDCQAIMPDRDEQLLKMSPSIGF
jgi:hypothetical protein